MTKLNHNATVNAIVKLAEVVIQYNDKANYNVSSANDEMMSAANLLISSQRLNKTHLKDLLLAREMYENLIDKKYNTELNTSNGKNPVFSMMRDTGAHLAEQNVPQRTQVALGLFDVVVGMVNMPHLFKKAA